MEEEYLSEDEGGAQDVQPVQKPQKNDQRLLVGLFVVLFASISIVGLQGITRSIADPFARKDGSKPVPLEPISRATKQEQTDAVLKKLDTDKDGLNDYDEIRLYGTSAFLDDSDGDGYADKTEILTGHDPICNETTQDCGSGQGEFSDLSVSTSTEHIPKLRSGMSSFSQSKTTLDALPTVTLPGFDRPMTIDELRNLSPQDIRAFLIRQGGSEKDLKKLDDAALKKVYDQAFGAAIQKVEKEQEISGSPASSLPPVSILAAPTSSAPAQAGEQKDFNPEDMTPEQLRDLLRKTGKISEEDLKKIDDETLKILAKQAFAEIKGTK